MNAYEIISVILAIASFLTILYIGLKTNILRESPPNMPSDNGMFSLGRFQLWVWTLIICPIFALYWGFDVLHAIDLNTTAVILLGIPAGVAVTSQVISASQTSNMTTNDHVNAKLNVQATSTVTNASVVVNPDSSANPSAAPAPVAPASIPPSPTILKMHQVSKSFFIDLISDDNGQLSLGRLQQLIFTLVFLIIYLTSFFNGHMQTLPDFNSEVFVLMGISSGTYLAAKGLNK